MVHFNLLIRGSKGGLVGHNLVQSDCPAQGDKGKAATCLKKWRLCFLNRAIFRATHYLLHAFRSNNFMSRHSDINVKCKQILNLKKKLQQLDATHFKRGCSPWKRIFDGLWTITGIKKIFRQALDTPPPQTPLKALLQTQLWNRGIRRLKGGSHNGCKKRFHANEVNALLYLWTAQLHYSYLEELSPLELPPPSKKKRKKKRRRIS